MLDVLDNIQPSSYVYSIAPLEGQDAASVQRRRRSDRLAEAVAKKLLAKEPAPQAVTPVDAETTHVTAETTAQASPEQALEAALTLDAPSEARPASTMAVEEPLPDDDSARATGTNTAPPTAPRASGQVFYAQFGKRR